MSNRLFLAAFTALAAFPAWCGPPQIDIVGLIPDQSTEVDFERAKGDMGLVIGGYEIICVPDYTNGIINQIMCVTGEDSYSQDTTSDGYRIANNNEIHKVLVKGFTSKFGKPDLVNNNEVTTTIGAQHVQQLVVWKDKKGNKLTLLNMAKKIDEGVILVESASRLRSDAQEKKETEKSRKF